MPELLLKRSSSATPSDTFAADGYDYFWSPPDWVIKDPQEHIIEGYASLPNLDDQGDVIPLDAIDAALPRFMKWGNLREMHDKKAAGKVLAAKVDERGLKILAKVEDPTAWAKVRAGVYQGFSVGGDIPEDATEQRADGARIIKELLLNEISLVDRPANPKARISVVKLEKHFTGKTHTHVEKPAAESEAQRRWAFGAKGEAWAREHHFDNPGKLPARVGKMNAKCNAHGKENCEECGCDRLVGHPPGADHSSGMADNPDAESRTGVGTCKVQKDGDEQACKTDSKKRKKTTKAIDMTTLEKVKSTLVDPDEIKTLEKAEELIAKASGQEWHTQRDVGNPNAEAETGVDLEDNDAGEEDPVDEVLDKAQAADSEGAEADGESSGGSGGKSGNDHLSACHGSLQAAHKALDDGHPAKEHVSKAMHHLAQAKKCFGKVGKANDGDADDMKKVSKALGSDNTEERLATLEEELEMVATKLSNTTQYFAKMFKGLPRSRPAPPLDERGWEGSRSRDEENGNTLRNARLSMNGNP